MLKKYVLLKGLLVNLEISTNPKMIKNALKIKPILFVLYLKIEKKLQQRVV